MKKILLLIATICLLLTLVSCGEPEVIEYHIDENGHLIGTREDATTVDLGSLSILMILILSPICTLFIRSPHQT